jgi:hypothetical protein
MLRFFEIFPWKEFTALGAAIYSAKKKDSEGGPDVTANEKQTILEAGRDFYNALEAAVKQS